MNGKNIMSIREKFLNKSIELDFDQVNQKEVDLMRSIDEVKKVLTTENTSIVVTQDTINEICKWYKIDNKIEEHRNLIKEITQKSNYVSNYNYPVVFTHNLLYVETKHLESFLNKENDDDVLRELTQLLALLKIHKIEPLENIARIKGLSFDSVNDLNDFMKYEVDIKNKIKQKLKFVDLIEHLGALPNDLEFNDLGKKVYAQVVYELEELLVAKPEEQNLIESHKNQICFNEYALDCYLKLELDENRKRESIQALYLIFSGQTNEVNSFSGHLKDKKDILVNFLKRQVTREEIVDALTKLPGQRGRVNNQQFEEFSTILKVEDRNKFIIFEEGLFNAASFDNFLKESFKEEQIVLYFMMLCIKENPDFNCKLVNNKTVNFSDFEEYFYLEDILKKKLSDYSLNAILKTVHDFQKDKIFTTQNEKIMDSVISENLVNKYAFNTINKEVLFINTTRCVFNEKLMSKIELFKDSELLELCIMTNDKFVKDLGDNIKLDKSIVNIKKYAEQIKDAIKYKMTEQDISEAINQIEEKSNTLIESKNEVFKDISILLNAKEVKEINNDIVKTSYREEEVYLYSFNEDMCDKLLKKELSKVSAREFCQALLIVDIKNKNISLKNHNSNIIRIHDNFNDAEKYTDSMLEKIYFQVTDEEIDKYLSVVTSKVDNETLDSLKHIINNVKKKCGIKTKSAFKHIL